MAMTQPSAALERGAASESIRTAVSENTDARAAALEIWQQLQPEDAACVVFFCSPNYELPKLAAALQDCFSDIPLAGCTTAGEISSRGIGSNSITALCLPRSQFVVETLKLSNLAAFSAEQAYSAVRDKLEQLRDIAIAPVAGHSFALSLLDGMSIREELALRAINDALEGMPLLGGSAGDNLNFGDTFVYWDGEFCNNSAVLILVNTLCPFEVISSHHFAPTDEKLVVTDADSGKRVAREINAEPAALEYCRLTGLSLDELHSTSFAMNPLAVQVGEQLYIRSIQRVNEDLSLTFFCAIDNGIVLTRVRDTGMIDHFNAMMMDLIDTIGEPQLVLGCDCIHRRIEAGQKGFFEEISQLYRQRGVIGFNTYGEQFNGLHVNHSFTGIAIGTAEPPRDE